MGGISAAVEQRRSAACAPRPGDYSLDVAGVDPRRLERVAQALQHFYDSGAHPGVSLCVRWRGTVVFSRALGFATGGGPDDTPEATRRAMTPDTPVCIFSASKAVTAVLVHKLAEEGGVSLEAPVSFYLPRFARCGKARVTIADVLCHRAGVASPPIPAVMRTPALLEQPARILDYICNAPLRGYGRPGYHALTGGYVLAAIIEAVTGMPFTGYLDTRLRQPLGMRYFTYGLEPGDQAQAACNCLAGPKVRYPVSALMKRALLTDFAMVVHASNDASFMNAVIPAGNLYATAEELSRFFQMLLDGGTWAGQRVLAPRTVARLLKPHGKIALDRVLLIPMRYSDGLMLGMPGLSLYGFKGADVFGHLGFTNVLGWAQPSRGLSVGLCTTGKAVLGGHLPRLVRLMGAIRSLAVQA